MTARKKVAPPIECCSFCDKSRAEVRYLVATARNKVYICDECVEICVEIIFNAARNPQTNKPSTDLKPVT